MKTLSTDEQRHVLGLLGIPLDGSLFLDA